MDYTDIRNMDGIRFALPHAHYLKRTLSRALLQAHSSMCALSSELSDARSFKRTHAKEHRQDSEKSVRINDVVLRINTLVTFRRAARLEPTHFSIICASTNASGRGFPTSSLLHADAIFDERARYLTSLHRRRIYCNHCHYCR